MRTRLLLGLALTIAGGLVKSDVHAVIGGAPVSAEALGMISIRATGATCTGTLLANDIVLSATPCFSPSDLLHPEYAGYFMGTQDSDRNPILEIQPLSWGVSIARLAKPLKMNGSTTGYERAVSRRDTYALASGGVTRLPCYGFGRSTIAELPYGAQLRTREFPVQSPLDGASVRLGPALGGTGNELLDYDQGGACLLGNDIAAIVVHLGSKLTIASALRPEIARFRMWHEIVSELSGRCVAVPAATHGEHASIIQWDCSGGNEQRWALRAVPQGDLRETAKGDVYEIRALHSNKCLSVPSGAPGVPVEQTTCSGEIVKPDAVPQEHLTQQGWRLDYLGNGSVRIKSQHGDQCLDLTASNTANGAALKTFPCLPNAKNQAWRVQAGIIDGAAHRLRSVVPGACADVKAASTSNGAQVTQYQCLEGQNQAWRLAPAGRGSKGPLFTVTAEHSHRCLEIAGGTSAEYGSAQQWDCNAGGHQKWRVEWRAGGGYAIKAEHTGMCLSLRPYSAAGQSGNGFQLQQETCRDTSIALPPGIAAQDRQTWTLD